METTIEEKHARTTVARRAHQIGLARISLANRLPWMERSISQGHLDVGLLLSKFELTRNANVALRLLRFDLHPDLLLHRHLKLPAIQYHILRTMYRCDSLTACSDGQTNAKADKAVKKMQAMWPMSNGLRKN